MPNEFVWAADTLQRTRMCPLELFENGVRLGPGHSAHAEIAAAGSGRFSMWSDGWLYFAASENSDPNDNGRTYQVDLRQQGAVPDAAIGRSSPALAKAVDAIRALPPEFTPQQAYAAIKRGLDVLYPPETFQFNADSIAAELADMDLVATRYSGYRAELSTSGMVFLSIMCAGRTWIRFFLQTYLSAISGMEVSMVPRTMPRTAVSPSLCFTHDFMDLYETIPAAPRIVFGSLLEAKPLIMLTRDLRDLVVSWFFYLRSSQPDTFARLVPTGTVSEFVDSPVVGLERLATVRKMQSEFFVRHPGPKLALAYERLTAAPRQEFGRLLQFISSAPVDGAAFDQALRKSAFDEMQALEIEISRSGRARDYLRLGVDNWSGDVNDLKVRSGKVGRYLEFLPQLADPRELVRRYPVAAEVLGPAVRDVSN